MQNSKIVPKLLPPIMHKLYGALFSEQRSVIHPSSAPALSSLHLHGGLAMADHMLPSLDFDPIIKSNILLWFARPSKSSAVVPNIGRIKKEKKRKEN